MLGAVSGNRAERAANDVRESVGRLKSGTLRVFGDWFGKPYDNFHIVVGATSSGDDLIVTFGDDEQLIVNAPGRLGVQPGDCLHR